MERHIRPVRSLDFWYEQFEAAHEGQKERIHDLLDRADQLIEKILNLVPLTPGEKEVFTRLIAGRESQADLAQELGIALWRVKYQQKKATEKIRRFMDYISGI